ncbi:hypothetical protein BN128_3974 [Cronobacter sakazakii 696]|nr:hypothetical protein BN128_3974 [Cronobacter sakazakii 696]
MCPESSAMARDKVNFWREMSYANIIAVTQIAIHDPAYAVM